jgi:hypothetical protein
MGLLLLLGLVFWRFVLDVVLLPAATVAWLFLRIFVLSLDQQICWWGLIFLACMAGIMRFRQTTSVAAPAPLLGLGPTRGRASSWREAILCSARETGREDAFKRELSWLLATLYSSERRGSVRYEIREALLQQQIPVPEEVYSFLFSSEASPAARRIFRRRIRRRTGREISEYFRSIGVVLAFMEAAMEMKE